MAMAASMAAMMLPTALPFFVGYARQVRRPAPVALVIATYVALWAAIGVAAYAVMTHVMLPGGPSVAGAAVVFAGLYALTPLMRAGQSRCQEMCREPVADPAMGTAFSKAIAYSVGCVACSAGVMVAMVLLGMTSIVLMVAGSALVLLYKVAGSWPRRSEVVISAIMVVVGMWLVGVL